MSSTTPSPTTEAPTPDQLTDEMIREAGYEPVKKKAYSSQRATAKAWREMKFPMHNLTNGEVRVDNPDARFGYDRVSVVRGAKLYASGARYYGVQKLDGSGKLVHYRTLAGIRTRSGLVITNTEDWAR